MKEAGSSLRRAFALAAVLLFVSNPQTSLGAGDDDAYKMPPKVIADLVDAPVTPSTSISPTNSTLIVGKRSGFLSIADLSQPELKLAGLRFNPLNSASNRSGYLTALTVKDIASGAERAVEGIPADPHIRSLAWAPDGKFAAFTNTTPTEMQLWVVDVAQARARQVSGIRLNGVYPTATFAWTPNGRALICRTIPSNRGPEPKAPAAPAGPVVQENLGGRAPVRTFPDLLKNAYDEALFEYHLSSTLVLAPVEGQSRRNLSKPELITSFDPSPDGQYLLVESMHRPFSYLVQAFYFPSRSEIRDRQGAPVKLLADLPLAENIPPDFDAVRTGPRGIEWRADAPSTIVWAEAQDEGNPKKEAAIRDRLFSLAAPFTATPSEQASFATRYQGTTWGGDTLAFVTEFWWKTRKIKTWRISPSSPGGAPELVFDRSSEDRYGDPGTPAMKMLPNGQWVMRIAPDGKTILLAGEGASAEGNRPFVDSFDLGTKKATRLWRSEAPYYESVVRFLDDAGERAIIARESVTEPLNLYHCALKTRDLKQITRYPHPAPQLTGVTKELIRYKRADGVELNGTLYLPPGYSRDRDGALPVLMWAYPAEFKSAAAAGQISDSPYRFVGPFWGGPLYWVLRGYAVLDDPTIPIIGEGDKEPNDTYIEQLVMGAKAAIDELDRRGVGDPKRVAVGGHSYGAFMTANLLAHSDLFRAGIARSGAYNRTLTPFGFQAEERVFWEAQDTYIKMSPFTYAHKINEPILMIHGIEDSNPGTFPIQSERLYQAIKGLGGTTRLVMLPKESHGYQARESIMHVMWEMDTWLEKYVKSAGK